MKRLCRDLYGFRLMRRPAQYGHHGRWFGRGSCRAQDRAHLHEALRRYVD